MASRVKVKYMETFASPSTNAFTIYVYFVYVIHFYLFHKNPFSFETSQNKYF